MKNKFCEFLNRVFNKSSKEIDYMKYLIVGIGNIGQEYANTRHNIGFDTLDAFAEASNVVFEPGRFGDMAKSKFKGRTLLLLKPSTYVNLSGKAVRYWLDKEKIPQENLLVIVDDLALPLASLRLRSKGSDAGHNGLKSIQQLIGVDYSRLRFGIGNDFAKGQQADFVLGRWNDEEKKPVADSIAVAQEIIKSFVTVGVARTMNQFNKK